MNPIRMANFLTLHQSGTILLNPVTLMAHTKISSYRDMECQDVTVP